MYPNTRVTNPSADIQIEKLLTKQIDLYDATFPIISDKANQDRNTIKIAEEAKKKHYNIKFNFPKHLKVIPLVIDSPGRWNGGLHEFVKKIARHTAGLDNLQYNKIVTRMGTLLLLQVG